MARHPQSRRKDVFGDLHRIGRPAPSDSAFADNASRLAGTSVEPRCRNKIGTLNSEGWDYGQCVPQLKRIPVLILEADDRNTTDNEELAVRLRKAGDTHVTVKTLITGSPCRLLS